MLPSWRPPAGVAMLAFAVLAVTPAHAEDTGVPHLMHEYEGWVALGVVIFSLLGAALLVHRALRR